MVTWQRVISSQNFSRWAHRSAMYSSTQGLRSTSLKITSGAVCIDPPLCWSGHAPEITLAPLRRQGGDAGRGRDLELDVRTHAVHGIAVEIEERMLCRVDDE